MLSLSRKVDYALIALAHLAGRPGRTSSAREIAEAYDLPPALLMNIMKELQQLEVVRSLRGTKGGYLLAIDPAAMSLYDLIVGLEGPVQTTDCIPAPDEQAEPDGCTCRATLRCPVQAPLRALHERLVGFLRQVRLADIIRPTHIDVPLARVGQG
ncbi:MAG TPA: Rrf2 family transcriptional regulator [Tepidisphaeraceae bacterium]|nr:Rrf2 family transcriptional regulator [Tepidisphaeraceae bacterium]